MKYKHAMMFLLAMVLSACGPQGETKQYQTAGENQMVLNKITPVLLADDLEACVAFWKEFGLEATLSVPHEGRLGFVSLQSGSIELMYQSFALASASNPAGIEGVGRSIIYLEVEALDEIVEIAAKFEIVIPAHTTPHGSREIYLRDPGGNLIGFAQQAG